MLFSFSDQRYSFTRNHLGTLRNPRRPFRKWRRLQQNPRKCSFTISSFINCVSNNKLLCNLIYSTKLKGLSGSASDSSSRNKASGSHINGTYSLIQCGAIRYRAKQPSLQMNRSKYISILATVLNWLNIALCTISTIFLYSFIFETIFKTPHRRHCARSVKLLSKQLQAKLHFACLM